MRLTQRGSGFVGDVPAVADVNLGQVVALGGEGDDRGVGDVGASFKVHGGEGRAVGGEGDDRGVGDVSAAFEGCEGWAVSGEGDDRGVGDVGAAAEADGAAAPYPPCSRPQPAINHARNAVGRLSVIILLASLH